MEQHIKKFILVVITNILILPNMLAGSNQDSVPLDPSIHYGKLPNGFTYYIKEVPNSPEVLMSYNVKVGIHNENQHQMEFSHIIEHLAFTSTPHFSSNLIDSLQMLKMRTGASTGDRRTTYNLSIASKNSDTLKVGIQWFREIANLTLKADDINNERDNMKQEAIYRVGYRLNSFFEESKLFSRIFPLKPDYSDLFEHLKSFPVNSLVEFYHKWYRPDRMGLIVVGDFDDIDSLENHIIKTFSSIPINRSASSTNPKWQQKYLGSPDNFVTQWSDKWGKSNESIRFHMLYRDKSLQRSKGYTIKGLHRIVLWQIIERLILKRIEEQQLPETYFESPKPWYPFYQIIIYNDESNEKIVLSKITHLLHQIISNGFTEEEWRDAKEMVKKQLGTTESPQYWKEHIYNHFLYQEALPINKIGYLKNWLTDVNLQQINQFAKQYLSANPNDIGILAKDRAKILSFSEQDVEGRINNIIKSKAEPYQSPEKCKPVALISEREVQKLKKVPYRHKELEKFELQEIILNNGVRVILHQQKSSTIIKNRITIHGYSEQGALSLPKTDYFSAIFSPMIIQKAGFGNVSGQELECFISSNNLSFDSYINPLESGIKLTGNFKNIKYMFQLIYSAFNNPNYPDEDAFKQWMKIEKGYYSNPYIAPKALDFKVAIAHALNNNSIVLSPGGRARYEGISRTDKEKAYQIYRHIFGTSSNFTFIISGEFSKNQILPLIQKYLGNLQNSMKHLTCTSYDYKQNALSKGALYNTFLTTDLRLSYNMHGSQNYMLSYISKVPSPSDWKESIKIKLLGMLINNELLKLRFEKEASLYNTYGFSEFNRYLGIVSLNIFMECTKDEYDWLRIESKNLISNISKNGFNPETFRIIKNSFYQNTKSSHLKSDVVYKHYRYNDPIIDTNVKAQYIKHISLKEIYETAKKYLRKEKIREFTLKDDPNI